MSPHCDCGNHVSRDWARVFVEDSENIEGCPACKTGRELKNGAGAGLNPRNRGLGIGEERA